VSEAVMLARHAQALFWAGRYIERAQDTARLLDVTYHSQIEAGPRQARKAWQELLQVLYLDAAYAAERRTVDAEGVNEYLVLEPSNPGAIVSAIRRARENARSVRELLSNDLWLAINDLYLSLTGRDVYFELDQHPGQLYAEVKRSCQTVMGAADETMPRTDGWRFLTLGALIERAEMTCRLLEVYVGRTLADDPVALPDLGRLLESASASEAYLRSFSASSRIADVIGFLLLSRTFPRSVFYCVAASEEHLTHLEGSRLASRPQRLLGRLRADLEFQDPQDLIEGDLPGYLERLQRRSLEIADAVADRFFTGDDGELQTQEFRGGPSDLAVTDTSSGAG
jgi:uncharacterized alpha-E superfamily protein